MGRQGAQLEGRSGRSRCRVPGHGQLRRHHHLGALLEELAGGVEAAVSGWPRSRWSGWPARRRSPRSPTLIRAGHRLVGQTYEGPLTPRPGGGSGRGRLDLMGGASVDVEHRAHHQLLAVAGVGIGHRPALLAQMVDGVVGVGQRLGAAPRRG